LGKRKKRKNADRKSEKRAFDAKKKDFIHGDNGCQKTDDWWI